MIWVLVGVLVAVVVVAGVVLVAATVVGRESEEGRRGGVLELDNPMARAALQSQRLTDLPADLDSAIGEELARAVAALPHISIQLDGTEISRNVLRSSERRKLIAVGLTEGLANPLQRCIPEKKVHYHGDGDWCECGTYPNARGDAA